MNTMNLVTFATNASEVTGNIVNFDMMMVKQMVLLLISDLVIIFILGKLLYNPVKDFLRKRTERIANDIDKSEKALSDANALKAEYEAKLKDIDKEKADILEKARKLASDKEKDIIDLAKDEANVIKNRAMLDIKREEDKARDDMKSSIIEISTLMASRYVATNLTEDNQNKLLDEVIDSLGEVKWQN
ncbi:MAG: F0F1 ATP synthase subunit B [Lachnospirales bacterium]